jgi:peptidoglycan hydrolase-like protein with peptidoglycan-binding domain
MSLSIRQSVGIGGVNQRDDVKLIQVLLNTYAAWKSPFTTLKVDGSIGTNTNNAIKKYQREAAGVINPDGRVDPNGKTFRYLTMYIKPEQEAVVKLQARDGRMLANAPVIDNNVLQKNAGLKGQTVKYSSSISAEKQIVSDYSMQIIKMALKEAGVTTGVITSTIRTAEEQAAVMLKNAKMNIKKQYSLYGTDGDLVLKVYEKNKSKLDSEIEKLMVAKIQELAKNGKRVSKHCVSKDVYLEHNVIDIGLNSMKAANKNFDAKKFTAALQKLKDEGYLETLIDETMKSNTAWHIEIKVNKKVLPSYEANTILNVIPFVK